MLNPNPNKQETQLAESQAEQGGYRYSPSKAALLASGQYPPSATAACQTEGTTPTVHPEANQTVTLADRGDSGLESFGKAAAAVVGTTTIKLRKNGKHDPTPPPPGEDSILAVMESGYTREEATLALIEASMEAANSTGSEGGSSSGGGGSGASRKKRRRKLEQRSKAQKRKRRTPPADTFDLPWLVAQAGGALESREEETRDTARDNAQILRALFNGSDIGSVFSHDMVEQETEVVSCLVLC
jgi:hypothetical protein